MELSGDSNRSISPRESPTRPSIPRRRNSLELTSTLSRKRPPSTGRWDWLDLSDRSATSHSPAASVTSEFTSTHLDLGQDDSSEEADQFQCRTQVFANGMGENHFRHTSEGARPPLWPTLPPPGTPGMGEPMPLHAEFFPPSIPYPPSYLRASPERLPVFHHRSLKSYNFISANVYVCPLPARFSDYDLRHLCMKVMRPVSGCQTGKHKIISVKVMVDDFELESRSPRSCKGFGFCLWNSVEAATLCLKGLKAQGYQANFARDTSRGMLSSLEDPTSANLYISCLPREWGEEELKALFGDTPIASARLLRRKDSDSVGTGASRGVGFVRLTSRSDALHFVELLNGMPVKGRSKGGSHLRCKMADSCAQKDWKRSTRAQHGKPQEWPADTPLNSRARRETLQPPRMAALNKFFFPRANNHNQYPPTSRYADSTVLSAPPVMVPKTSIDGHMLDSPPPNDLFSISSTPEPFGMTPFSPKITPLTLGAGLLNCGLGNADATVPLTPNAELHASFPVPPMIPIFPAQWSPPPVGCFCFNGFLPLQMPPIPEVWNAGEEPSKVHGLNTYEEPLGVETGRNNSPMKAIGELKLNVAAPNHSAGGWSRQNHYNR